MNKNDDRKAAVKKLRSLVYSTKQNVEVYRKKLDETFYVPVLPNHVEFTEHAYNGIQCDVLMPVVYSSNRIMIYVHGGAFVGGSRKAWRGFCSSVATACSCRVVVPEYRLAPAYAFPAAMEDLQSVFRSVFTEEQIACSLDSGDGKGNMLPEIVIAADGSGASIAMALVLSLRERYRACISNVILFSPWLNMSPDSEIIKGKKVHDEILSGDCIRRGGDVYTYTGNLENQMVSPVFASEENLKGFPDVYIQMGEKEILLEDAKTFKTKIEACGGKCVLDVVPDMMFMFQMADEYLSEAHLAIERIGKLITSRQDETDEETLNRAPVLEDSLKSEA